MKNTVGSKCDCGTKYQAKVWCYLHGYLVKLTPIKRSK